jgi:hypothetical protein
MANKNATFEMLKTDVSVAKNVDQWNTIRDHSKTVYGQNLINRLDTSGYIAEVATKNNWPKPEKK